MRMNVFTGVNPTVRNHALAYGFLICICKLDNRTQVRNCVRLAYLHDCVRLDEHLCNISHLTAIFWAKSHISIYSLIFCLHLTSHKILTNISHLETFLYHQIFIKSHKSTKYPLDPQVAIWGHLNKQNQR